MIIYIYIGVYVNALKISLRVVMTVMRLVTRDLIILFLGL